MFACRSCISFPICSNFQNARLKENIKEMTINDTSMTTVRDDMRGTLLPQRSMLSNGYLTINNWIIALMDFDEEPTQLEAKSNLSRMKEKEKETEYTEVSSINVIILG